MEKLLLKGDKRFEIEESLLKDDKSLERNKTHKEIKEENKN